MPIASSGNAEIAYDDLNADQSGDPVVLVHGFASNRHENWQRTGWYAAFEAKRRRVIALDNRGHGESTKLHEPEAYALENMSADVLAVMDHAGVETADIMGYSLGGAISVHCVVNNPDRFSNAIFGGIGKGFFDPDAPRTDLGSAMDADDPESLSDPLARGFRLFAEQQGEDRKALAACARGPRRVMALEDLAAIRVPTLVVAGQQDDLAGNPQLLADAIPGAKAVTLPGCDHMYAIPHPLYKAAVMDFLEGWLDV